jgi:hypothetical protein
VPKLTFPFNKHPIEGIPRRPVTTPSARSEGYYVWYSPSANPPLPDDPAWIAVDPNVFSDGVSPDHTTYLSQTDAFGATDYIHVMYYVESPMTLSAYKLSWAWLGIIVGTVMYSDGDSYFTFDPVAASDNGGVLTFQDLNQNPADVTAIACVVSAQDTPGIAGIPCQVRISEFIPVFA